MFHYCATIYGEIKVFKGGIAQCPPPLNTPHAETRRNRNAAYTRPRWNNAVFYPDTNSNICVRHAATNLMHYASLSHWHESYFFAGTNYTDCKLHDLLCKIYATTETLVMPLDDEHNKIPRVLLHHKWIVLCRTFHDTWLAGVKLDGKFTFSASRWHVRSEISHQPPIVTAEGFLATLKHYDLFMAALCNRAGHYIFALWFIYFYQSFYLFSSPNLSGRRLDVYHTSTHGVALVRI